MFPEVLTALSTLDPYDFRPGEPGGVPADEYQPEAAEIAEHLGASRSITAAELDRIWLHWFDEPLATLVGTESLTRFVTELNDLTSSRDP